MKTFTRDLDFVNFTDKDGNEYKDLDFVNFNGVTVYEAWKKLIASGVPPITLQKCKGVDLVDYKIYGDSKQKIDTSNIWDGTYPIIGSYYDANGNITLYETIAMTNMMELKYSIYDITCVSYSDDAYGHYFRYNFFDENKQWLSQIAIHKIGNAGQTTTEYREIEVPTGAKYINFSVLTSQMDKGQKICASTKNTPTSEFPIEIESVGDKTPNIIDYTLHPATSTYAGITYTNMNNGSFIANGTLTGTLSQTYFDYKKIKDEIEVGETYYASCGNDYNDGKRRYYLFINIMNSETGVSRYFSSYNANKTFTLAENEYIYTIEIRIYSVDGELFSVDNLEFKPIICKASEFVEYEPYGYRIPVKVSGKNLLPTSTVNVNGENMRLNILPAPLKLPLTFSWDIDYVPNNQAALFEFMVDGASIKVEANRKSINLTGNTLTHIRVLNWPQNTGTIFNIQLEKGAVATEFESYVEPITTNIYLTEPLRKIGDYSDYIDFEKKQVVRKIYKENITTVSGKSSITGTYAIFYSRINKNALLWGIDGSLRGGYAISNKFEQSKYYYEYMVSYPNIIQSHQTTSGAYVAAYTFGDSSINTVALAKEKIGDGFEINYVLQKEIPETIELTNIPTFKGTTIIEVDTDVNASNMELKYWGKGKNPLLDETESIILNDILQDDTETELDLFENEIIEILDKIIGG